MGKKEVKKKLVDGGGQQWLSIRKMTINADSLDITFRTPAGVKHWVQSEELSKKMKKMISDILDKTVDLAEPAPVVEDTNNNAMTKPKELWHFRFTIKKP